MRELSSYYLSEKSIHGLGDMWILEAFHEASFFGGEGLVTRVVGRGRIVIQTRSVSGLASWINPKLR